MAIAFDAFTSTGSALGNSLSFTHTPVSTAPKGVLILHAQDTGTSTEVSAVTYGGIALSAIDLSPVVLTSGSEDGVLYGYFLGSSVPSGAQTVAVTVGGGAEPNRCGVFTLTATVDTEVEDTASLVDDVITNPSVTLDTTTGRDCFVAGLVFSGQNAVGSVTEGAGYTALAEHDFGGTVINWERRTANSTGGSVSVPWTAGSAVAAVLAVALREAVVAGGAVVGKVNSAFLKSKLQGLVG